MSATQSNSPAPILRRRLIKFDADANTNKYWEIKLYDDGRMITTWGRVGVENPPKISKGDRYLANAAADKKIGNGYHEVQLATVSAAINAKSLVQLHPHVEAFVNMVYREAGLKRETYLTVSLDALSQQQILRARDLIAKINIARTGPNLHSIPALVNTYFNTVPSKLPARIDKDQLVKDFIANLADHEENLLQLEAAIASNLAQTATADPDSPLKALGGVTLKPMEQSSPAYGQIVDFIEKTSGQSHRITSILGVKIPTERAAYEANTFGVHSISSLFHGTKNQNLQYILKTGLIIPKIPANGSRFGLGIYFADQARLSHRYAGGSTNTKTIFVCDVAVGNPKIVTQDDSSLRQAPLGYHSVWAKKPHQNSLNAGMDEIIIFRPSQQTIRAIVTLE